MLGAVYTSPRYPAWYIVFSTASKLGGAGFFSLTDSLFDRAQE
jgi:hypothetical protein